jgi:dTDP-glucose pyrophosphorylase
MYAFNADSIDAGILTFKATHPKWSYAKLDDNGFVSEVAEKKVISDNATVGVYFWKRGSDYVKYAERMMKNEANRVNGEWYVCPVFNEAIQDGKKVRVKHILKMWGIGTPEDLNTFLADYKGTV